MFKIGDRLDKNIILEMNPVVLAFIGDAVHSLFIRSKLSVDFDYKTGELNKLATSKVNAKSQANYLNFIFPLLNDEEISVYKRARNAKKSSKSKSATVSDYNTATGFEAVLGYLYLLGEIDRINFLLSKENSNEN